MKNILLLLAIFSGSICGWAQDSPKYLISFRDKGDLSRYASQPILSERALAQRAQHGIPLHISDYPVEPTYRAAVQQLGVCEANVLRWFNGVTAYLTPAQVAAVKQLPCVAAVSPLATHRAKVAEITQIHADSLFLNTPKRQLNILHADALHNMGYTGRGVLIAMMDNGFRRADSVPAFRKLMAEGRVIATKDYVQRDANVFDFTNLPSRHGNHGAYCFSILASDLDSLRGAAPDASFILLRTENDSSETRREEDNWAAAAEYADSLGAQIFSTSLGYSSMDDPLQSYDIAQMDGRTALISRAASMAAQKGILVVNAMGNEGANGITAPADADSILSVGSVNQQREYSWYSSVGPTADGRIKPEITTMGEGVFFMTPAGDISRGNGTSFSCPIIAGLAACLLQANPMATNMQLRDAIIESGDRYTEPDTYYGYGIPDGRKALQTLYPKTLPLPITIFGNPSNGENISIGIDGLQGENQLHIEIYDAIGRKSVEIDQMIYFPIFPLAAHLSTGSYVVRISNRTDGKQYSAKIVVK